MPQPATHLTLNDLLTKARLDPERVLVFRHRPPEPDLRKRLQWLAAERPDTFNAYQMTQNPTLERVMGSLAGDGHIASFIGHEPGKAVFVGLYRIGGSTPLSFEQYWAEPFHQQLKELGMRGWSLGDDPRSSILRFDLAPTPLFEGWRGRLIVGWPPPERSWWRRAHRNEIPVHAIREADALTGAMPDWADLTLSWADLAVMPGHWRAALAQWRGIYFIFDASDGKGYVGSAYGTENLLGRWRQYAARGDGGNVLLRQRDPAHFTFAILQRVSPDMEPAEVIQLEASWKARLHTRAPHGLNDN